MKRKHARYLIGIDLGTTQSALAWLDADDLEAGIRFLQIPQFVSPREVAALPTLPSLLYLPEENLAIPPAPWNPGEEGGPIAGEAARELGSAVPSRLIHSAKSWLSHPRIDRSAPILPWQSDTVAEKLSPVAASARLLRHLVQAWNHVMLPQDPKAEFTLQDVVITVPASFDPSARNLTLEAIAQAGISNIQVLDSPDRPGVAASQGSPILKKTQGRDFRENAIAKSVTLLEEPQAAFYDFLVRRAESLKTDLAGVKTVLVIDIGGGTSDFSLIGVEWPETSSKPQFSRLAVGPHLLIGGDNLDLAVARGVEARLKHRNKRLLTRQWLALLGQSKAAKERLLSNEGDEPLTFTLSGAGSSVLAGTLKETLQAAETRNTLLEGFFPVVSSDIRPSEEGAFGLSEAGLPYTRDPAVTRHLAAFLADNGIMPDAVLFNGGTMNAPALRKRLVDQIAAWRAGNPPIVIDNPHPTLAVAAGAVAFGMARHGLGERIKSGNPASLYLGIGTAKTSSASRHIPEQVLCLLPKGAESEREEHVEGKSFGFDRGRDTAFYLYFSPSSTGEKAGETARYNGRRHKSLPPLTARAEKQAPKDDAAIENVNLTVKLRETGYLEIACKGVQGDFRRDLSFAIGSQTRDAASKDEGKISPDDADSTAIATGTAAKPVRKARQPLSKKEVTLVKKMCDTLFAKDPKDRLPFPNAFKRLEEILEMPRKDWELPTLRALFDVFVEDERFARTEEGAIAWFRFLGFCARPGFGAVADDERLDRLWSLMPPATSATSPAASGARLGSEASTSATSAMAKAPIIPPASSTGIGTSEIALPFSSTNTEFWSEWWLLWKRIGAGLSTERQRFLLDRIESVLFPPKRVEKGARGARKVEQHERNHLWRLLGHLERLPVSEKERLGNWITKAPPTFSRDMVALYALGRLGARELSYADHTLLVSGVSAQNWAVELLRHGSANISYLDWALKELGRKVGDRLVQIDEQTRRRIVEQLKRNNRKKDFLAPLHHVRRLEETEIADSFGEALPNGFLWVREDDPPTDEEILSGESSASGDFVQEKPGKSKIENIAIKSTKHADSSEKMKNVPGSAHTGDAVAAVDRNRNKGSKETFVAKAASEKKIPKEVPGAGDTSRKKDSKETFVARATPEKKPSKKIQDTGDTNGKKESKEPFAAKATPEKKDPKGKKGQRE
ncbi:MAG: Hsp70 family protein [Candidatus Ozemobacteraceae bacterium]